MLGTEEPGVRIHHVRRGGLGGPRPGGGGAHFRRQEDRPQTRHAQEQGKGPGHLQNQESLRRRSFPGYVS